MRTSVVSPSALTRVLSVGTPGIKRPAAGGDASEALPAAVKPQKATKDQQQQQQGKKQKKGPAADASNVAGTQRGSAVAEDGMGGGPNVAAPLAEKLPGSKENSGGAGTTVKKAAVVGKKAKAAAAAAAQGGDENGQWGEASGEELKEKGRSSQEGEGQAKGPAKEPKAEAKTRSRPTKRAKKEEKGAGETAGGSGGEETDGEGEGKEGAGGRRRGGAGRSQRAAARGKRYAGQDDDGDESDVQVGQTEGCMWGCVRQLLPGNPMSRCLWDEAATRPAATVISMARAPGDAVSAWKRCCVLSSANAVCPTVLARCAGGRL